jgi:hypothetical protein
MEIYAQKIPEEMKADVLNVASRVQRSKISASLEDVKYLFKVYKEYLAPHDRQNIDCKACRAKVCGIFFSILRTWKNKKN